MICVIGGGAAGVFAAAICAAQNKRVPVILLEKTLKLLSKVRISGGGRCNVTHAAFDTRTLVMSYPRGRQELLGPFEQFGPSEMVEWLKDRGVTLKIEEDGRMFPITDSSETIAEALLKEAAKQGVTIQTGQKITQIAQVEGGFLLHFSDKEPLFCQKLLLATGSSPQGYAWAQAFGHTLVPPVPSLFTFNVPSSPLLDLSGITVQDVILSLPKTAAKREPQCSQRGPLLLTHFGFSGPAALKLSAFAARQLHALNYDTELLINWLPKETAQTAYEKLLIAKQKNPLKSLENYRPFDLPFNLWKRLLQLSLVPLESPLSHVANLSLKKLSQTLTENSYHICGKTTYKQEFVTAGGIPLKEIHFKTMESKLVPGLHFAGEIIDVDGITGGFNFQNAWTTGLLAGKNLAH